ncbi:unnamed protein product, partial [Closterium sp. Naga37s-1]
MDLDCASGEREPLTGGGGGEDGGNGEGEVAEAVGGGTQETVLDIEVPKDNVCVSESSGMGREGRDETGETESGEGQAGAEAAAAVAVGAGEGAGERAGKGQQKGEGEAPGTTGAEQSGNSPQPDPSQTAPTAAAGAAAGAAGAGAAGSAAAGARAGARGTTADGGRTWGGGIRANTTPYWRFVQIISAVGAGVIFIPALVFTVIIFIRSLFLQAWGGASAGAAGGEEGGGDNTVAGIEIRPASPMASVAENSYQRGIPRRLSLSFVHAWTFTYTHVVNRTAVVNEDTLLELVRRRPAVGWGLVGSHWASWSRMGSRGVALGFMESDGVSWGRMGLRAWGRTAPPLSLSFVRAWTFTYTHVVNRTAVVNEDTLLELMRRRPKGTPLITISNHMSTCAQCWDDPLLWNHLDDPLLWNQWRLRFSNPHLCRWTLKARDIGPLAPPPCFSLFSLSPPSPYHLDDPLLWNQWRLRFSDPHKCRWTLTARDICFTHPFTAYLFRLAKCIPIDRHGGIYQPGMTEAVQRLSAGGWLHIFPEGRITQEHVALARLKWGLASVIDRCTSPVPPIILCVAHSGFEN